MSKKILAVSCLTVFLFMAATSGFIEAQTQVINDDSRATAIKDVASQPASNDGETVSVITAPTSPSAISVSAIVTASLAKASSSSSPSSATASFNKTVTLPTGITSMTIYVLNAPINMGMATINLNGSSPDWPIYINSNIQTITSDTPVLASWLSAGTYDSLTVYNHDTNNQWNPLVFYITWQ